MSENELEHIQNRILELEIYVSFLFSRVSALHKMLVVDVSQVLKTQPAEGVQKYLENLADEHLKQSLGTLADDDPVRAAIMKRLIERETGNILGD